MTEEKYYITVRDGIQYRELRNNTFIVAKAIDGDPTKEDTYIVFPKKITHYFKNNTGNFFDFNNHQLVVYGKSHKEVEEDILLKILSGEITLIKDTFIMGYDDV